MEYKVTFNGDTKSFVSGKTYYDVALSFSKKGVLAVQIGNEVLSLDTKITESGEVVFLDVTSLNGYKIYQAALKFLYFVAVKEIYPDSKVSFLHSVPKGILSEIQCAHNLTSNDVSMIKGKMARLVTEKERFIKYNMSRKDAYDYLKKCHEEEKAFNLQTLNSDIVTMYRLKNYLNYFYNLMPYDVSVINRYELVFLGRNRIVLVCPNFVSGENIPEYVHYENIVHNFMETKRWLMQMNTPYLAQLNQLVIHSQIQDFISSNEILFEEDILKATDLITNSRNVKMVLIAGPSSSGKTTTMKRLSSFLRSRGYHPVGLSTDDFFVDREATPLDSSGNYDFECLQAIDLELFNKTLKDLLDGLEVSVPEYDFVRGKKVFKGNFLQLKENSILLIEGLHCLNDDLIPYIDSKYKLKIYLSPFIPLNIDRHNYVSTLDLRLIRRIIRDNRTRGKSVSETISEWQVVRSGEEKYIFPYVYQADLIINTALAYEIGVLKVYAMPLLYSVGIDSSYFNEARRLIQMLHMFFSIPSEFVPKDSILREFIG